MKINLLFFVLLFSIPGSLKAQHSERMLDSSFGKAGRLILPDSTLPIRDFYDTRITALGMQGNKILSAGYTSIGIGSYQDSFKIIRYNVNGTIDKSFGTKGITSYIYPDQQHRAHLITDMQCQLDSKIIMNTYFWGTEDLWGLLRLNKNGTVDSTFGISGFKKTANYTSAMIVLPDDKIVTANYRHLDTLWYIVLHIIDKNGIDINKTTIALDRKYLKDYFSEIMTLRLTLDKKIVLGAGLRVNDDSPAYLSSAIFRYNLNGSIDSTFNGNGQKYIIDQDNSGDYNHLYDLSVQSTNNIIVAFAGNSNTFRITRLLKNGNVDSSFGSNGTAIADFGGSAYITAMQTQNDDKIIAFGTATTNGFALQKFALARFNKNGLLDSSFGLNGLTQTNFYEDGDIKGSNGSCVIIQPDGKIAGAGTVRLYKINGGGRDNAAMARYLPKKNNLITTKRSILNNATKINNQSLLISPNPVKDILHITNISHDCIVIQVIDAGGKFLKQEDVTCNSLSINLSTLNAGIYYLKAIMADKSIETIKFFKN